MADINKTENSSYQSAKAAPPPRRGPMGGGPMAGMMPGEKPKNFKETLRKTMKFLRPHYLKFIIVIVLSVLSTVFAVAGPRILGTATTSIANSIITRTPVNFIEIGNIILLLVILYFISALFGYIQQYIMAGVSQKVVYDMRKEIDRKLSVLPLKYYDSKTHGEILSRVTNDVDTVSNTLQQSTTQIITSVVTLAGILAMMISISWILTLIAVFTIPASLIFTIVVTKRSQKYFKGQQRNLGELNGHVEEMYAGHTIVKAYSLEEKAMGKFSAINENLYENSWKAQFISGTMMPILSFIGNIGYVFICVAGGIFVTRGTVTIGGIQAFIQYSRQFSHPIVQTAQIANILQSTVAAAERVFEVLEETEEIPDAKESINLSEVVETRRKESFPEVEFKNVKFGYTPDNTLITDLSFKAFRGQTVAIVGPTGAGKTTLVNLLMRFYEIGEGEILVENTPVNSVTRSSLRRSFGMVLQDTWLFKGTIRENIAYGCENVSDQAIIEAATLARADHFIQTLPEGYETVINEEASNISSGQKQLLTIARAILANPQMLILDEATSSVDTRTEILIQKGMKELMKGRTSFVIAHRLSTIRHADIILVMNNGDIVEKGSHNELIESNGFYADLYRSQFA